MSKRKILSELDKLEQSLATGRRIFYTDIVLALGCDTEALVAKAKALRVKVYQSLDLAKRVEP